VKRAVLTAFVASQDKDRLMQIAERKEPELRIQPSTCLGPPRLSRNLATLPGRDIADVKKQILWRWPAPQQRKLLEVARTEKTPDSAAGVQSLAGIKAPNTATRWALLLDRTGQGRQRTIVSSLFAQKNVKALSNWAARRPIPK